MTTPSSTSGLSPRSDATSRVVRVKICGVTSVADARLAAECGADAVGVLVGQRHPSPDFVSAEEGRDILAALPSHVIGTLVSHENDVERLSRLIAAVRPKAVQIHSELGPPECAELRNRFDTITLIKSFPVTGPASVHSGNGYADAVDGFHLDSRNASTGQVGGTGITHDWSLSAEFVARHELPVMLAGGLTPGNVAAAIARVKPEAVDVNSGVKGETMRSKDAQRMRDFIRRVREVAA